ncbi:MAG TPA: glycine C-acetyltransferase [Spirochaetia bacterium]|nr:glycine C-acetyltransferase [Spirochaetia bacterium]
MFGAMQEHIRETIRAVREAGLYKDERILSTSQGAEIGVSGRRTGPVLNFCANNYLGLAADPRVVEAAKMSLDRWGYGLSSVRFICGTQEIHRELEGRLSRFLGTEDTILYSSCFDANGGLFETILGPEDVVISDALNHASIIDGIRLCKARRLVYETSDMESLERRLLESKDARFRLVATDGVFSMDGAIARLDAICDLAERYDSLVMVDDSHAIGVLGDRGRGTHSYRGVMDRVDIITGTLGKALGGASGGYTSGRREIIELLRQRSRPYLFSNSVAPTIVSASIAALDILETDPDPVRRLLENARRFRSGMAANGFVVPEGVHPIVPVMLGDAALAGRMAAELLSEGVYVVGFSYPVVPPGKARIRVQLSAVHTPEQVTFAVEKFNVVKRRIA